MKRVFAQSRNLLLLVICSFFLFSCGSGGGGNGGKTEEDNSTIVTLSVIGIAQKGPLIRGSSVVLQELDDTLSPTGRVFNTETIDDTGVFQTSINTDKRFFEISVTGYFFDEVIGDLSASPLTIRAISDLKSNPNVKVNVLTHLAKNRIITLVKNGTDFESAQSQAEAEVLSLFGINETFLTGASIDEPLLNFDELDITKAGYSHAILLSISSILLETAGEKASNIANVAAELSNLLAQMSSDIQFDGILNDTEILSSIKIASTNLDLATVRTNVETWYADLEDPLSVPEFEKFVDSDGDGRLNIIDFEINFTPVETSNLAAPFVSNEITIVLPEGTTETASVSAGTIVLNGIDIGTTIAQVSDGDKIAIRLLSAAEYEGIETTTSSVLTIGPNESTFVIITKYPQPTLLKSYNAGIQVERVVLAPSNNRLLISGWRSDSDAVFNKQGFQILDVSNPASPEFLGGINLSNFSSSVHAVSPDGNKAYVTDFTGSLYVVDISNPANIKLLGQYNIGMTGHFVGRITLSSDGQTVYIATGDGAFLILDVSNPNSITQKGALDTTTNCAGVDGNPMWSSNCGTRDIALSNDFKTAFLATMYAGLKIVDTTDPKSISVISTLRPEDVSTDPQNPFLPTSLVRSADETTLYVISHYTVYVFDITDLTSPKLIGSYTDDGTSPGCRCAYYGPVLGNSGEQLYVAEGGGYSMINIAKPASPRLFANYYEIINWGGPTLPSVNSIAVSANESVVYAGFGVGGLRITNTNKPDPLLSPWVTKSPMTISRQQFGTVVLNGQLYVLGGVVSGPGTVLSVVERYDPTLDTWTTMQSMPHLRYRFYAAAFNGKIYVFGGSGWTSGTGVDVSTIVDVYDPSTDSWQTLSNPMPRARNDLSGTVANGKIYLIGGQPTLTIDEYDPNTDSWVTKSASGIGRQSFTVSASGADIYIMGGWSDSLGTVVGKVDRYNPLNDVVTEVSEMPIPVQGATSVPMDGFIYLFGGSTSGGNDVIANTYRYNPSTNSWLQGTSMPTARYKAGSLEIDSLLFVIGGEEAVTQSENSSLVEAYNPSNDY